MADAAGTSNHKIGTAEKKKKKKRLAPTLLQSQPRVVAPSNASASTTAGPPHKRPRQSGTASLSLADKVDVELSKTPACEVRSLNTHVDLQETLARYAAIATQTQQQWARDPDAQWIQTLKKELLVDHTDGDSNKKEALQKAAKKMALEGTVDVNPRFSERADFAFLILELWFEDKSLETVLAKAQALGQMDLPPGGLLLTGDVIKESLSREHPELGDLKTLFPLIERIVTLDNANTQNPSVPLSKCRNDNKVTVQDDDDTMPLSQLKEKCSMADTTTLDNCGSLNTTHQYGVTTTIHNTRPATAKHCDSPFLNNTYMDGQCGVTLLDELYDELEDLTSDPTTTKVVLNTLLYLIWKGPGYMTAYHQDTHVRPQITIYNQLSGESVFHFLPPLLGMYVSHVAEREGAPAAAVVLKALDDLGIGCTAHLVPGSVAMILPFGSHGVFVPKRLASNESSSTSLSTIRAAELFVEPLYREYQAKLAQSDWCRNLMPMCPEDLKVAEQFEASQQELMTKLGISHEEWIYHSNLMLEKWTNEEAKSGQNDKNTAMAVTEGETAADNAK